MFVSLLLLLALAIVPATCSAQKFTSSHPSIHHPRFAMGVKMSTLGAGIETAMPLTAHSNLRVGFNMFLYNRPFDTEGITYQGELSLRSGQLNYDWFPFHGRFHLSPGVLLYNGNTITAKLFVPAGQVFQLDHQTYRSSKKDPIRGSASISFMKVAPMFLFGWGNLIPHKPRHFSIPVEFGIVYHGDPSLNFDLSGKGCDAGNHACKSINSDPRGVQNINSERSSINRDISVFRFYPVISAGFGYSF